MSISRFLAKKKNSPSNYHRCRLPESWFLITPLLTASLAMVPSFCDSLVKSIDASIDTHSDGRSVCYGVQRHVLGVGNLDRAHWFRALRIGDAALQRALGLCEAVVCCTNRHIQRNGNERLNKMKQMKTKDRWTKTKTHRFKNFELTWFECCPALNYNRQSFKPTRLKSDDIPRD